MVLAMRFLKKLKYTLLFKSLKNNIFILLVFLILFLIFVKTKSIIILSIIALYGIYVFLKHKILILITSCLILLIIVNFLTYNISKKNIFKENDVNYLKVIKTKKINNNYQITFKKHNIKIISYTEECLIVGGVYEIKGSIEKASTAHFKGGFDYNDYLNNQKTIGILQIEKIDFHHQSISIFCFNNIINQYFDKVFTTKAKGMIKALTIGNKDDFDEQLLTNISNIGISHLFVISGLHINIIYNCLIWLFSKLHLKQNIKTISSLIILLLYYLISGLMISVLRVILSIILKAINDKYEYGLSNKDLFSLNVIIILIINPFYLFQYSFILSYLISGSIIICNHLLKSTNKNKFFNFLISTFKVSTLATFITLPIVAKINYHINFLSCLYNLFYIPLVTYIFLPFSFLLIIIPRLEIFFYYFYQGFSYVTNLLSKIKIFMINFPNVHFIIILVYYVIFYLLLIKIEKKQIPIKLLVFFILLLFIWNQNNIFNIYDEVYFLDLPKGEATFIRKSHNKANILIDTGENGYDDIILFLKSLGIKRLDMVIISHSDSDHNGMLDEIISEFKIKKIYYNQYDQVTKLKINDNIKHMPLKCNDCISLYDISLKVISPKKDYKNTNDNSLVIIGNVFGTKYLFTGDISKKIEITLNNSYLDIDVLKVAHHGSNTSSSDEFLSKLKYDYAICMNGYKNQFSFPSSDIKNKFKDKLYITSIKKTICIRKYKYGSKFIFIKPK